MPLPASSGRKEVHHRSIDLRVFQRDDGLFDVEARLVDTKPFPFQRLISGVAPPGQALHDLWLRIEVDDTCVVHDIVASPDATPFTICPEAAAGLQSLVGERIGRGWNRAIREKLRRTDNCTHLVELLQPLATVALMGVRAVVPHRGLPSPDDEHPAQLDTCYGFAADREVVRILWPRHHRPPVDDRKDEP